MSYSNGPKIVTDGLFLCLDAANKKSYPGSGTTWYDLSGNSRNGTIEGATFNLSNKGVLNFDGTEDRINCGSLSVPSGNLSIFTWIYPTAFNSNGWNIMVTKWFNSNGSVSADFHYAIRSENLILKQNVYTTSNSNLYGTSTSYPTNNWYYMGITLVNGGTLSFYKNGAPDGTASSVSRSPGTSLLQIGDHRFLSHGLIGNIPHVSIYTKALSADEILQNYNALKGRYGLT